MRDPTENDAAVAPSRPRPSPLVCRGHTRPVPSLQLAQTPDTGEFLLLSSCKDGQAMLRDGRTGDWLGTFLGHKGVVWDAKLSPDGSLAVTGSGDFSVKVWDTFTGACLETYAHPHVVRAVDVGEEWVVSGGMDRVLRLWRAERAERSEMREGGGQGDAKGLSEAKTREGDLSETKASEGGENPGNAGNGDKQNTPEGQSPSTPPVGPNAVTKDAPQAATKNMPGELDATTSSDASNGWKEAGKLGKDLGKNGRAPKVTSESAEDGKDKQVSGKAGNATSDALPEDCVIFKSSVGDGKTHAGAIRSVWIDERRREAGSMGDDRVVRIFSLDTHEEKLVIPFDEPIKSLTLSLDKNTLCIASGKSVYFISLDDKQITKKVDLDYVPSCVALRPIQDDDADSAENYFVTGTIEDFGVRLHRYDTGELVDVGKGHHGGIHCVSFTPDGKVYASGSEDGTIRLWLLDGNKEYGLWTFNHNRSS